MALRVTVESFRTLERNGPPGPGPVLRAAMSSSVGGSHYPGDGSRTRRTRHGPRGAAVHRGNGMRKDEYMTGVRVLVGTRKGAFVLTSDGARTRWDVGGPYFGGWEIYHLQGSPTDPDRLYASQSTSWFGQLIQRSDDGGRTWAPVGNEFRYDGVPGTHQWYDGTPHPWEFARVWHLEPSLTDPDTIYAGVEDAALFRTTDGGP